MNRRSFLATASLPAATATLMGAPAPHYDVRAEIRRYRKIDVHNHIFLDRGITPSQVIAAADRLQIEKVAISMPRTTSKPESATPALCREANDFVLRAMKDFPGRFLGQCFVNPYYRSEALEEITRCINSGMVMLGELYTQVRLTDPRYFPIIEKCIELKAPLLSHGAEARKDWRDPARPGGSNADDFAAIAKRYSEAMIIYGHIGGGGDWEYVCKVLRDAPTVYADTSGSVTDEGMIDFAVQCLGVRRLLFATDLSFENGVAKILAARLTEPERRQIFFDNFNNILRKRDNHVH
jgi:predicted TIM-barrel fold metal-dependent hydrolase